MGIKHISKISSSLGEKCQDRHCQQNNVTSPLLYHSLDRREPRELSNLSEPRWCPAPHLALGIHATSSLASICWERNGERELDQVSSQREAKYEIDRRVVRY